MQDGVPAKPDAPAHRLPGRLRQPHLGRLLAAGPIASAAKRVRTGSRVSPTARPVHHRFTAGGHTDAPGSTDPGAGYRLKASPARQLRENIDTPREFESRPASTTTCTATGRWPGNSWVQPASARQAPTTSSPAPGSPIRCPGTAPRLKLAWSASFPRLHVGRQPTATPPPEGSRSTSPRPATVFARATKPDTSAPGPGRAKPALVRQPSAAPPASSVPPVHSHPATSADAAEQESVQPTISTPQRGRQPTSLYRRCTRLFPRHR